jgi:hypothetical protein
MESKSQSGGVTPSAAMHRAWSFALCSGGPYDLIAFWLIAVDHFCDLGAEVVNCFGLTYAGRASPDILQHILSRAESE